jgi:nucleoside-diphosphate-sugar epimerase
MSRIDPQRRWCVFGGSGAVGRYLLPALGAAGVSVVALSRQPQPDSASGLQWVQGSLEDAPALQALIEAGARFEVICSLGPLDAFAAWLHRHPPARGVRVLALSSMSAEWKSDSPNPGERALARALIESEQRVLALCAAHAALATVLRCGLIHGAGVDRSLTPLLNWARRRPLPWPRAAIGLRQPVHARDLARALIVAAPRADLAQRVLALPGPEALSFPQMVQRSLAASGRAARVIPVPVPGLFRLASQLARLRGRAGSTAATLRRLYTDQLGTTGDWALLGIALDELGRVGGGESDQFQHR